MNTEAMKLALEAAYLAGWNASGEGYNAEYPFGDHARNPEEDAAWIKDRDNALQQALAQPQQEPVAWANPNDLQNFDMKVRTNAGPLHTVPLYTSPQPAQPQQEPVAWAISYDGKTPYAIWPDGDGALLDLEVKRQGGTTCKLPLYTSPPARKPLTRDQVKGMLTDAGYDTANLQARWDFRNGVRQCEAAHGIKEDA